jgi:hypothetical protein
VLGNGKLEIEHVRTEEQIADILTKPLGRVQFLEMRSKLGVVKIGKELQD